jgi:hypothetical protein
MGACISTLTADLENGGEWIKYKVEDVVEYLTESKLLIETLDITKYYDFLSDSNYGWKYLDTPSGNHLLASPNGNKWINTENGITWISSLDGYMWLNGKYRRVVCCENPDHYEVYMKYENTDYDFFSIFGRECEKCNRYLKWRSRAFCECDGQKWLETENGQKWFSSLEGVIYVDAMMISGIVPESFKKWIASEKGYDWISTTANGKIYFNADFVKLLRGDIICKNEFNTCVAENYYEYLWKTCVGKKYFSTEVCWKWISNNYDFLTHTDFLTTKIGKDWMKSDYGFSLLTNKSSFGKNTHPFMKKVYVWLESDDGQEWLLTENGQKFLGTSNGFSFLVEIAGIKHIEKNINWLQSDDGRRFKKYIQNDSKFMTTESAQLIYKIGLDAYFFPNLHQ